jgi:hypothetical protein
LCLAAFPVFTPSQSSELILKAATPSGTERDCVYLASQVRHKDLLESCYLILIKTGEPGVFVGKIIADDPIRAFLGYVDKTASEKKIVRDVFKHGDAAFLSGTSINLHRQFFILICCYV